MSKEGETTASGVQPVQTASYDRFAQLVTLTSPARAGPVEACVPDEVGNLRSRVDAAGGTWTYGDVGKGSAVGNQVPSRTTLNIGFRIARGLP